MSSYFANLRPFEKRVVVGVGALFFVVLNLLFVWPRFSDWNAVQNRLWEANRKRRVYENEIALLPSYERQVKALEAAGLAVPQEDQSHNFATAIISQAAQSKVNIQQNSKITTRTNQFFLESTQSITVQSGEEQLVNFLYNLGSGSSLIRVRDLSLRPDAPRQNLAANVKLVASYQKKPVVRVATAPAKAPPASAARAAAATKAPTKSLPPAAKSSTPNTKRP